MHRPKLGYAVTDRKPDDLLTARDVAEQYGMRQTVAENLVRNLGRRGLAVTVPGFRRIFVRRSDLGDALGTIEPNGDEMGTHEARNPGHDVP